MKIAVLVDTWFPFVGGGQINAWEISKRISQKGHNIEIITRNCGRETQKSPKNLKVIKFGAPSKPQDDIARIKYLLQAFLYLYKNDFNLVVAHAFLPGLVAKMFMVIKRKPAVLVVHGTSIGTNLNKSPKGLLERFILTQIKYSVEITVSRDFFKIKNVNKNIVYIPNGVDPLFFKTDSPAKREGNSILFIGRLHPQKNLINLIKAIKILVLEKYLVKLTIVGDGPQKQEISALTKKYGLDDYIKLEKPKHGSELAKYYKSKTVFILPSVYEGQALTLLEAWASKMPVIVSKTGDHRYLVKEGITGYFINNQSNPKSIAQVIKKTLSDKNLTKVGQNGYNLVKDKYTWEKSAKVTKNLYEKILEGSIN